MLESEKRDKRMLKDKVKEVEAMLAEAHEKHDQQLQSLREHLEQVVSELDLLTRRDSVNRNEP